MENSLRSCQPEHLSHPGLVVSAPRTAPLIVPSSSVQGPEASAVPTSTIHLASVLQTRLVDLLGACLLSCEMNKPFCL